MSSRSNSSHNKGKQGSTKPPPTSSSTKNKNGSDQQQKKYQQQKASSVVATTTATTPVAATGAASSSSLMSNTNINTSNALPSTLKDQLKQKVAHDIRRDLTAFFSSTNSQEITLGAAVDEMLALVPQGMFTQHLPSDVVAYRSYMPQFIRRAQKCGVLGFLRWFEWATHIHQKLTPSSGDHNNNKSHPPTIHEHDDSAALQGQDKFRFDSERAAAKKETKNRLADMMKQREHIRALLAMCQRPSQNGRRQGVHALVNYFKSTELGSAAGGDGDVGGVDAAGGSLTTTTHQNLQRRFATVQTMQDLKDNVDANVAYGLTRLVLGMATESFANVLFNFTALHKVLETFSDVLSPNVLFTLLDSEFTLTERMNAVFKRNDNITRRLERGEVATEDEKADIMRSINDDDNNNQDGGDGADNNDRRRRYNTNESLNDPTRGERHQKTLAALFAVLALWESRYGTSTQQQHHNTNSNNAQNAKKKVYFSVDIIRRIIQTLCYLYIEHKGMRVLTANLMFRVLSLSPRETLDDRTTRRWLNFTFFSVPEIQYLRPEGVQFLLLCQHAHVMSSEYGLDGGAADAATSSRRAAAITAATMTADYQRSLAPAVTLFPKPVHELILIDPLAPVTLEQFAVSLFRKDQVTAVHPLLHPVWDLFLRMITERCEQGESLHRHLTNFLHNVITPFRRGVTDVARQQLFNVLIRNIGRLALQSSDADERSSLIEVANKTVGFGKTVTVGKATDEATLRRMTPQELEHKVRSLGQQLIALSNRPSVTRIRTWIMKELKASVNVPQFSTVLPTFVNECFSVCFAFGFFTTASAIRNARGVAGGNGDTYNQNKAIYLCCESVAFRALTKRSSSTGGAASSSSSSGNKSRLPFSLSYVDLMDRYLEKERNFYAAGGRGGHHLQRNTEDDLLGYDRTRFGTAASLVPSSSSSTATTSGGNKIRKARDAIEAALRSSGDLSSRSVLFYKQNELIDGVLFLLFLELSIDDPQNNFVQELAASIVGDLLRFIKEGTINSVSILFDVLMAISMRDVAPLQVAPIQLFVRKLCLGIMCQFAQFLSTKEDFDMILSPLIDAFNVDAAQAQRRQTIEKRKKKLEKLGVDAAEMDDAADAQQGSAAAAAASEEEDEEDDDNEAAASDDDDDDDEGTEADEDDGTEADDDDEDEDANSAASSVGSEDEDFYDRAADFNKKEEDDEWEKEGEDEAPTAEYLARLKKILKMNDDFEDNAAVAAAGAGANKDGDNDGRPSAAAMVVMHSYPPVPANKAQTDVIHAINVATRVTALSRSSCALRALHVCLAVMRETVKSSKNEEVFAAASNAIDQLIISLPRFVGGWSSSSSSSSSSPVSADSGAAAATTTMTTKSNNNTAAAPTSGSSDAMLLGMLRDVVGYCRRMEKTLIAEEMREAEEAGGGDDNENGAASSRRNPIEFAAFVKRNLIKLKRTSLRVTHYSAFVASKNFAGEPTRLLFLEHYKAMFADRGWEMVRLLPTIKQDMFHFRQGFAWCIVDAVVEKLESVRYIKAARRIRVYITASQFLIALMPRLSRLTPALLERCRSKISAFLRMFTVRELFEIKSTLVYEFVKTLQFAVEYQKFTHVDLAWAGTIAEEIINDDALKITIATRRALSKLERALGQTENRAEHTKQVEPLKALRRNDAAQKTGGDDGAEQLRPHKRSQRSMKAEQAVAAKRLLKDRDADAFSAGQQQYGGAAGGGGSGGGDANNILNKPDDYRHEHGSQGKAQKRHKAESHLTVEEQRKRQEAWEQMPAEEKAKIRARATAQKQERMSTNRKQRRAALQVRDEDVARWRDEKLQKASQLPRD